jgi:hypothetical protein
MKRGHLSRWGGVVLVVMIFASWVSFCGTCEASNANLSFWTKDLSGSQPEGEIWSDFYGDMAVVGSNVHAIWGSMKSDWSEYRLFYRRSVNNGLSFKPVNTLFSIPYSQSDHGVTDQKLAVDGKTVHIVVSRGYPIGTTRSWYYDVFYFRSTDNGATFEPAKTLFSGADAWHVHKLRIAADRGRVTVGFNYYANWYSNYSIVLMNSEDKGGTFTQSVAAGSSDHGGDFEDLKRVGNRVFVLHYYLDEGYYYGHWQARIGCASSTDGGKTFVNRWMTTPAANGENLTYGLHDQHYSPNLAVAGSNVYVVWMQNDTAYNSGDVNLYFRRSTNSGKTFSKPVKISRNLPAGAPLQLGQETIAAAGNYVYVAFITNDSKVYLKRSKDKGVTFFGLQELTAPSGCRNIDGGWWPLVKTDPSDATGAKVHVLWNWPTYLYSSNGGNTFSNPVLLSPQFSWSGCNRPQFAVGSNGSVHWVAEGNYYSSGSAGDSDIFYRVHTRPPEPPTVKQSIMFSSDWDQRRYDNMQVPASGDVNYTTAMTVEAWIKPNRNDNSEGYFVFKADPGVGGSWGSYMLGQWRDGKADARIATTTNGYVLVEGAPLPNGVWSHVAMTYDANAGENNFRLYVNGGLAGSMTATGKIKTDRGILFVGGDQSDRYYSSVTVDELRLWNRALLQSELKANMKKVLLGTENGLRAYYNFDGTTKDITGHGNDGVLMYKEIFKAGRL